MSSGQHCICQTTPVDDFVRRFEIEHAGSEKLARYIWVACKDAEPYLVSWRATLDRLDELLNLLD